MDSLSGLWPINPLQWKNTGEKESVTELEEGLNRLKKLEEGRVKEEDEESGAVDRKTRKRVTEFIHSDKFLMNAQTEVKQTVKFTC